MFAKVLVEHNLVEIVLPTDNQTEEVDTTLLSLTLHLRVHWMLIMISSLWQVAVVAVLAQVAATVLDNLDTTPTKMVDKAETNHHILVVEAIHAVLTVTNLVTAVAAVVPDIVAVLAVTVATTVETVTGINNPLEEAAVLLTCTQ